MPRKRTTQPATPTAPSAEAIHARYQQTYWREISPGFWAELRKLPLTGELLRGTLPNEVLKHVLWDEERDDDTPKLTLKAKYEGYRALAARALVQPKLVVNREPDRSKGEIAATDLNYVELYNVYYYAVKEVVPPVASAPFPARRVTRKRTRTAAPPSDHLPEPNP